MSNHRALHEEKREPKNQAKTRRYTPIAREVYPLWQGKYIFSDKGSISSLANEVYPLR